ncbi:MAG: anti-sigma factor antagonist [Firmicutes bacterium]|nr:anti-sigma factor antagonist [Bacillota bacterium]HOB35449.1 anti-sigma factor antagonist [Bacillota bacterium]HPZ89756.1 anti-sigma factor antagonist [Bacillota bacterium]HQE01228.1 anti-sigma factor antagonist [Bacillota bacterium]
MKITKQQSGDILVVGVSGELDHHSSALLKSEIGAELDKGGVRHIILDLRELTFMDSSGLGVLLGRYKELGKWQGKMLAFGLQPVVEKMFRLTGLNQLIPVHPDLASCYKALGV